MKKIIALLFILFIQSCQKKDEKSYLMFINTNANQDSLWNDAICDTLLNRNNTKIMKFKGFELIVPNSYKYSKQNGEDSFVGEIGCGKITISFDYGPYGWSNFPYEGGDRYHFIKHSDNFTTKTIAYSEKIGDNIYVWLKIVKKWDKSNTNKTRSVLSNSKLNMYACCSNEKEKRLLIKIYQSVKMI